jgi:carboxylesterase
MNTINPQADFIQGNRTGCLLIHGFGGTLADFGDLPERLASQGYSILTVRLAGHGTTPAAFYASRAEAWLASVEAGFDTLRQHCPTIVVVGFSLGGVLGLLLTQRHQFDGLVTIGSRVITVPSRSMRYAPLRMLLSLRDPSLAAAFQLCQIVQQAARILPMVQLPLLVMHGCDDDVVTHENAEAIITGVSSTQKELVWWQHTGHQMLEDGQHREAIYQRIAKFVTDIHENSQQL